jgi:hypothetical protein
MVFSVSLVFRGERVEIAVMSTVGQKQAMCHVKDGGESIYMKLSATAPAVGPGSPTTSDNLRDRGRMGAAPEAATLEPFVIYQQICEIDGSGDVLCEMPVSFDIPADLPGTHLNRAQATYWQVFLQVPVTGPDFETAFLAPVYERQNA